MGFQIVSQLNPVVVNMSGGFVGSITGNTSGTPAVVSSGTMYLSGGNNITLSQNGNTIEISGVAGGGGGADGFNRISAGTQQAGTNATVVFSNSNNVSFGMSNSSIVTASASFNQSVQTQNMVSIEGSTGNIDFANANGITFGFNNSTITASHNGLTTARASNDAIGLNTAFTNVTATVNSSGLSINASGYAGTNSTFNGTNISGSITQNSNGIRLDLSVAPGGGAGDGYNIIGVNGAGTSASTTLQLSNANNVTFGLNAGTITASASYSQSTQPVAVSASNGSFNFSTLKFVETNGVTWATSTDGIRASVKTDYQSSNPNYLTSQSNQAFSASGGSSAFQTLNFANSNGITFSNSNGSVIASHNGLTTARASNDAIGLNTAQTNVTWTVNSSGLSLDARGYAGTATGATNANVTANSGGISVSIPAQTNQTVGGYFVSNTTGQSSSSTYDARSLSFQGAGIASVGASGGSIVISVPAGGGGGDGYNSAQFTNSTANSTMNILWAGNSNGSGNITMGLTGSTVTASAPSGGGGVTLSGFHPYADLEMVTMATSQGTLSIEPMVVPNVQFDRLVFPINNTNSSNSSGSHSLSFRVGIYTQNGSTLSLLASASASTALTHSGTQGSYSLYSGMRLFSIGLTTTLTEGRYWLAFNSNTTSGGANGSYSLFGLSNQASNFLGIFGSSHNTTYQFTLGQGIYTASTTAIPSSIGFSQIRGSDSAAFRSPYIGFASSTV